MRIVGLDSSKKIRIPSPVRNAEKIDEWVEVNLLPPGVDLTLLVSLIDTFHPCITVSVASQYVQHKCVCTVIFAAWLCHVASFEQFTLNILRITVGVNTRSKYHIQK